MSNLATELRRVLRMPAGATDAQIIGQVEALARYAGPVLDATRPHVRLGEKPDAWAATVRQQLERLRTLSRDLGLDAVEVRAGQRAIDDLRELVRRVIPPERRGLTLFDEASAALKQVLGVHAAWLQVLATAGVHVDQEPTVPASLVLARVINVDSQKERSS